MASKNDTSNTRESVKIPGDISPSGKVQNKRVGICLTCGYERVARSAGGVKPSRCPECGSRKCEWEDRLSADELKEIDPLRHTTNRKKEEGAAAETTPPPMPKPTPAARETAKQTKKIADVAKVVEPAEAVTDPAAAETVTEPEKISLAGLPEGTVQTIKDPALYAADTLTEPGYVAWENEAGETEYGVIVREDLLEAMQETVAAETAAAIVPVGLEDVEILREAGLLGVAHADEFDDEEEAPEDEDPNAEEEIEEEEITEDDPEEEPANKKQGIPVVGALIILGGMAAIAYFAVKAPTMQKITRKEPTAAEKAMYRMTDAGKVQNSLNRISNLKA